MTADGYLTAKGSATIIINKAPLTVTANNKSITYGDAPANDGVQYSGFVNGETESVLGGTLSYDYNYDQYGDVGDYTITPKGLSSDNYDINFVSGTLTVNKAEPAVTAPIVKEDLIYTDSAQELISAGSVINGTMYYAVTGENTAPTDEDLYDTSIPIGTNAGTYYVWYKVIGDENYNDVAVQSIAASIGKATVSCDYSVTGKAKPGSTGIVDVFKFLEEGGSFGDLTVESGGDEIFEATPSIADGKVSYNIKSDAQVNSSDTITVPVTECTNYNDYNITITVIVTDKDIPIVTVSDIETTYTGDPVAASSIKGSAIFNGKAVDGTWTFKDTQGLTNVSDTGPKQVIFIPSDSIKFETVEATLTLTINKADVTGSPTYKTVNESEKTLQDAEIGVGTLIPADGNIVWDLPDNTVVERETSYTWTYTPKDTANYNTKTGSVILWSAASGGESAGGNYESESGASSGGGVFDTNPSGASSDTKKANTLTVKEKTYTIKVAAKNKKSVKKATISAAKVKKGIVGAKGTVTYKKYKGNSKITISKKGKITVRKGIKTGKIYTLKVLVNASGTDSYKPSTKIMTVKIKVKS